MAKSCRDFSHLSTSGAPRGRVRGVSAISSARARGSARGRQGGRTHRVRPVPTGGARGRALPRPPPGHTRGGLPLPRGGAPRWRRGAGTVRGSTPTLPDRAQLGALATTRTHRAIGRSRAAAAGARGQHAGAGSAAAPPVEPAPLRENPRGCMPGGPPRKSHGGQGRGACEAVSTPQIAPDSAPWPLCAATGQVAVRGLAQRAARAAIGRSRGAPPPRKLRMAARPGRARDPFFAFFAFFARTSGKDFGQGLRVPAGARKGWIHQALSFRRDSSARPPDRRAGVVFGSVDLRKKRKKRKKVEPRLFSQRVAGSRCRATSRPAVSAP
jgi:hypothetical protein